MSGAPVERARELFRAGVNAADPLRATRDAIVLDADGLALRRDHGEPRRGRWRGIRAVGFGKAACAMASALEDLVAREEWRGPGIAVTNHDNVRDVTGFEVLGAGHPLPDEAGVRGAERVAAAARELDDGDLLLVLISGGGSAILPAPAEGISLADKVATTDLLLASGADIGELNTVRKHLSTLKGGGLARLAAPASVHALILSDVIGDDPSTIASGPTVPDRTTFADAVEILERRGLLERVPESVRRRLLCGRDGAIADTPKPDDPIFSRAGATLVGGNGRSLDAVRSAAAGWAARVVVLSRRLCGEARAEAVNFAAAVRVTLADSTRPLAVIAGGETTVTVRGRGRGGRNQELALAFALEVERIGGLPGDWVFLSGGTDGRDGPTDAAGGIVHPRSLERMRAAGIDPAARLEENDSHAALAASNDLLVTGATGTNVADLQIFLAE